MLGVGDGITDKALDLVRPCLKPLRARFLICKTSIKRPALTIHPVFVRIQLEGTSM